MSKDLELEYIKYFPRQWLERWLVQLRKLRGSLTFLHTRCGLNARYTNVDPLPDPQKYDIVKLLRMMCGMCEYMEEDEFVDFGADRLREFHQFYMKHGKSFREQYKREKRPLNKQFKNSKA